jgi:hypothetical protein
MFLLLLPHSPVAKPSDLTLFCRKKWSLRSVCNLQQFMQTPILLWHLPVAKSPSKITKQLPVAKAIACSKITKSWLLL